VYELPAVHVAAPHELLSLAHLALSERLIFAYFSEAGGKLLAQGGELCNMAAALRQQFHTCNFLLTAARPAHAALLFAYGLVYAGFECTPISQYTGRLEMQLFDDF
jgi:hypothetical protein